MSMQQPPQNPYTPPAPPVSAQAHPGAGPQGGYGPPVPQKQARPIDKGVLRQLIFGGVLVVGFEAVTGVLSQIGSAVYGVSGLQIIFFFIALVAAAVFAALVAVSALYISPIEKARNTVELLKKLAIGGAIGLAGLVVINLIWSVINGGSYLFESIASSAIFGSLTSAITFTALFALGVLIARSVPATPRAAAPQFGGQPGYGAPQGYAPQQGQAPQGYGAPQQQAPQGYGAPQQQAPQGYGAPQQQAPQQYVPQQPPQYPATPQGQQPPYPPRP